MPDDSPDLRWIPDAKVVREIANQFGTPVYVIDELSFRTRIQQYLAAFRAADPKSELTYASKANSVLAILRIAFDEGCLIDTASEGEFRAALLAGVPARNCHMHGNNKSQSELKYAADCGIGQIVVDNQTELEIIRGLGTSTELILRLAPGVLPITNEKISTGQQDTKFGFSIQDGSAEGALQFGLEHGLNVVGIHCHVGSQLLDPEAQIAAGRALAEFAREMFERFEWSCKILNLGGGRAVRYVGEAPVTLDDYCQRLVSGVRAALDGTGVDPVLVQEPGRALIAEAGVTVYQVGHVKEVGTAEGAVRRYILVDGGLADNPRPALYDARYDAIAVAADGRELGEGSPARVSGRHCETDLLIDSVILPSDLRAGDYLVVLTTGAYSSSMASNYNRYLRPPTVLVRPCGAVDLVQEAENFDSMFARERLPQDLP